MSWLTCVEHWYISFDHNWSSLRLSMNQPPKVLRDQLFQTFFSGLSTLCLFVPDIDPPIPHPIKPPTVFLGIAGLAPAEKNRRGRFRECGMPHFFWYSKIWPVGSRKSRPGKTWFWRLRKTETILHRLQLSELHLGRQPYLHRIRLGRGWSAHWKGLWCPTWFSQIQKQTKAHQWLRWIGWWFQPMRITYRPNKKYGHLPYSPACANSWILHATHKIRGARKGELGVWKQAKS